MDTTPLPEPDMVQVGGVPVATWRLGPTGGTPVVLCHGTPWSSRVWWPVARRLAETHRVHLWDMPGYGRSITAAEAPIRLPDQARRLRALTECWGLDRPVLVAHDVGGAVAVGAHLQAGLPAAGLALFDVVLLRPWGSPFFRLVTEHRDAFEGLPPHLHRALARAYVQDALGSPLPEAVVDDLVEPWLGPAGQAAFYRQMTQLLPEDTDPLVSRLGDLRCPVTIGWGALDPWLDVEQADRLAAAVPGRPTPTRFAGAGHLVPLEVADAVTDLLLTWCPR